MGAKSIVKILVTVSIALAIASAIMELNNITVVGNNIINISNRAAKQAAILYSQETYKARGNGGASSLESIEDAYGAEYVSGNIYGNNSGDKEIYESLRGGFYEWCSDPAAVKGGWDRVRILSGEFKGTEKERKDEEKIQAMYIKNMITPTNMGIPYLDKDTVERIFKWNIAKVFSGGVSNTIVLDDGGDVCVQRDGFRIYANESELSIKSYVTYDLNVEADKKKFEEITQIDTSKLGISEGRGIDGNQTSRICVATMHIKVPVAYIGVSPIRHMVEEWSVEREYLESDINYYIIQ